MQDFSGNRFVWAVWAIYRAGNTRFLQFGVELPFYRVQFARFTCEVSITEELIGGYRDQLFSNWSCVRKIEDMTVLVQSLTRQFNPRDGQDVL